MYGKYPGSELPLYTPSSEITELPRDAGSDMSRERLVRYAYSDLSEDEMELDLQGEVDLNLVYGNRFPLKRGTVAGAGSGDVEDGLQYTLIEKVLLLGTIGERLSVYFNYDSERTEEGIGEEKNIYSVSYRGKEDEFLQEVTAGNRELAIEDSRFIPIDEGNQDSFALRGRAGWRGFSFDGLLRYNEAYEGKKTFSGLKDSVRMEVLDTGYAANRFFFLPDTGIEEESLILYRSAAGSADAVIDGRTFRSLRRGDDYDFDNTTGWLYLTTSLNSGQELAVYYEKGGYPVGGPQLGQQAIIDGGVRTDFNSVAFPGYFDSTSTYLYLKKRGLNSYWELRNGYYLEDFQGQAIYDLDIELFFTSSIALNTNYDGLLSFYEVDTKRGVIFFIFTDTEGLFYPRPFPGEYPYTGVNPTDPFDPDNQVYGGVGGSLDVNSVNTLSLHYSYSIDSYFLNFNVVPGSVKVSVDGQLVDASLYTVDYDFGILTLEEGVVRPSSSLIISYRYTGFGGGDQSFLSAFGVGYDTGLLRARNLTAYETPFRGREAPAVGEEGPAVLSNSTEVSLRLGAEEEEIGGWIEAAAGAAVSAVRPNAYGYSLVADMETEESGAQLALQDIKWVIGTKSSLLPGVAFGPELGTRGNLLYKNYLKEGALRDTLQGLDWDIPQGNIFSYGEKAGPYNASDYPSGGDETSLVLEYEFEGAVENGYVTTVIPLEGSNYSAFERFNLLLRGRDISGGTVRVYAEMLGDYDEDTNGNGLLDGEASINDAGFGTVPVDGNPTVIGTDRNGSSNGRIDGEDLNRNGILDSGPEQGVIFQGEDFVYLTELSEDDESWQHISVDVYDLIDGNRAVFENAQALRITVTVTDPSVSPSGRIVLNKAWFSGAAIVNNNPEFLTISEVSWVENGEVSLNKFSGYYPGLYEDLHGDAAYRDNNDLVERVLQVRFNASVAAPLTAGSEATVSKRFPTPGDFTSHRYFRAYLFVPHDETIPDNLFFTIGFLSGENQKLEAAVPAENFRPGWNEIAVNLSSPYGVSVNGAEIAGMTRTGSLNILKRVSEVRFGLQAEGGDVNEPLEIWLDEWHLYRSKRYVDKALFSEFTIGYWGNLLDVSGYALVRDPALTVGYERREGNFTEDYDDLSNLYFSGLRSNLFQVLDTDIYLSRELTSQIRNNDDLPTGLGSNGSVNNASHELVLDLGNDYIPVLEHEFRRSVTNSREVELQGPDYLHTNGTEYDESIWFSEAVSFPFGFRQKAGIGRNWFYRNEKNTFPDGLLEENDDASLDQVKILELGYDWGGGGSTLFITRDEQYTGLFVPHSGDWGQSYAHKLKTIYKTPGASLEDASLFTRTDSFGTGTNIPLVRKAGFTSDFGTVYTELNFGYAHTRRDTIYRHSVSFGVPFFAFGDERVILTPSMQRTMSGDYRRVEMSLSETEIFAESYTWLFRLPLYYMGPFKGIGRGNDYKAVDIYETSPSITGNTSNTLFNRYTFDADLDFDRTLIPVHTGIGIDGTTTRSGATYGQSRGFDTSVTEDIPLRSPVDVLKSLLLTLGYRVEKRYDTKVLMNRWEVGSRFERLRSAYRGIKLDNGVAYQRERQKPGDINYRLFPGVEDSLYVHEIPYRDTIEHEALFQYLWQIELKKGRLFWFKLDSARHGLAVNNTESLKVENIYTATDRERAAAFSNIPLRVTVEHDSSYAMTENVRFSGNLKAVAGIEEKVFPDAPEGNVLSSMGLEFGISMQVLF